MFSFIKITIFLGFIFFASNTYSISDLDKLILGNKRYINSSTVCHKDWSFKRFSQAEQQNPFAIILTCSDSRVPPEIIFDQSLGDLFVIRMAGNVVDDFAIGSIEYGISILGAKLIVVLGHSNCGAVKGALKGLTFDNHIQEVLDAIKPAILDIKNDPSMTLEKAIKANVIHVKEKLKNSQPVLMNLQKEGKIIILGAYYNLASGSVEFF